MIYLQAAAAASPAEAGGLSINLFWVIVAALNFIFFLALITAFGFKPIAAILMARQMRVEQGLADAEAASKDRSAAQTERDAVMLQARQEANALIAAAQKAAADAREADIAATKGELEQMRVRAAADIAAERDRAMADLRSQVAELALDVATKVTGETMTDDRQRRLVNEFINQRQDPSGTSN